MGPALALGLESRHELFDVDLFDELTDAHLAAIGHLLPEGIRVTGSRQAPSGDSLPRKGRHRSRLRVRAAGGRSGGSRGSGSQARGRRLRRNSSRPSWASRPRRSGRVRIVRRGDGADAMSFLLVQGGGGSLMPFTVRCHATFEAAHQLRDYVGGPEPLHGHSWKIEVALTTERLGLYDISVDFVPAEGLVRSLAGRLAWARSRHRCTVRPEEPDRRERRPLGGRRARRVGNPGGRGGPFRGDRLGRAPQLRHLQALTGLPQPVEERYFPPVRASEGKGRSPRFSRSPRFPSFLARSSAGPPPEAPREASPGGTVGRQRDRLAARVDRVAPLVLVPLARAWPSGASPRRSSATPRPCCRRRRRSRRAACRTG